MAFVKRNYVRGQTVITSENLNQIQDEVVRLGTALDNGDFDGKDGVTPSFQIGTVTTLEAGSKATASITGTPENPILNLGIPKGQDGSGGSGGGGTGNDGVGISSIEQTTTSTADDGNNIITVTLTNGNKYTFTVQNGSKGTAGKTPARGTDYWTPSDIEEIKSYVDEAILGGAW